MDTPYGSQDLAQGTNVWRSATSVSYARSNFTAFSMPFFPRTTHPTASSAYHRAMNCSPPACPTISIRVFSAAITIVQPGYYRHRARHSRLEVIMPHNPKLLVYPPPSLFFLLDRTTFQRSRPIAQEGKEVQYCPSQYRPNVETHLRWGNLVGGW